MAIRIPLGLDAPDGEPQFQVFEMDSTTIQNIHNFAPYVIGQNPAVRLEVNTANGSLLGASPQFQDSYYIAGASTTRVDRYATEAETPNVALITDNYDRLRIIKDSVSLPTGDTNNTQFPLYIYSPTGNDIDYNFWAMSRQDFIDTFVSPALTALGALNYDSGSNTKDQAGTYYLSTNSAPAGGTAVSATPVAVNAIADTSAYTAGGIGEVQKQVIETNYYIIKVDPAATEFDVYDADVTRYDLPLYFDSGTETIKQHTPTTWANLLGPWLRYYTGTAGSGYEIDYNLTGTGNQKGTTFTDTVISQSGTGYNTRFVNANDYRTQEFPTGTPTTDASHTKALYIGASTVTYGLTSSPLSSVNEGASVTFTVSVTSGSVANGTQLPYSVTGISSQDLSSGSLTGNVTMNSNTGSVTFTLRADTTTEGSETMTFSCQGLTRNVTVNDTSTTPLIERAQLEGLTGAPELDGIPVGQTTPVVVGWRFKLDGTIEAYENVTPSNSSTNHAPWLTSDIYVSEFNFGTTAMTASRFNWYILGKTHTGSNAGSWSSTNLENTWYPITSTSTERLYTISNSDTLGTYGDVGYSWEFRLSASASGGQYTSAYTYDASGGNETYISEYLVETNEGGTTVEITIFHEGVQVYGPTQMDSTLAGGPYTGNDGFTYRQGSSTGSPPVLTTHYQVRVEIPEEVGYYRWVYNGGA